MPTKVTKLVPNGNPRPRIHYWDSKGCLTKFTEFLYTTFHFSCQDAGWFTRELQVHGTTSTSHQNTQLLADIPSITSWLPSQGLVQDWAFVALSVTAAAVTLLWHKISVYRLNIQAYGTPNNASYQKHSEIHSKQLTCFHAVFGVTSLSKQTQRGFSSRLPNNTPDVADYRLVSYILPKGEKQFTFVFFRMCPWWGKLYFAIFHPFGSFVHQLSHVPWVRRKQT